MEAVTAITSELAAPAYDIHSLDTKGKVVLLRADLNVPVVHGRVTDVSRISAVLGTIKLLLDKGSRVAVISHFGRPDPSKQSLDEMRKRFSLKDVAAALAQLLPTGSFAGMAADCIGPDAQDMISSLQPGQVRYWGLHSQFLGSTTSSRRMHAAPASLPLNQCPGWLELLESSAAGALPHTAERLAHCSCACWRTCASMLGRQRIRMPSPASWHPWQTSMSTMPLGWCTGTKPASA